MMVAVHAPDAWYLKGGLSAPVLGSVLTGRALTAARRIGKLLLLDTGALPSAAGGDEGGPTLGLRFGMTGRLLVDGAAGVEHLEYASRREEPAWDRLVVTFADGGDLRVRDPRRLGGVFVDPDERRLGVDAAGVGPSALRALLAGSTAPLKARLMDQARLAGVGNLTADEVLFRAGLDPARPAGSLSAPEVRRLHRHLRSTLDDLLAGGGSHCGRLQAARVPGGRCPRDGSPLVRRTVGGRTTWSCPQHQR